MLVSQERRIAYSYGAARACPSRKLYPDVMVVQPAEYANGHDAAGPLNCPLQGRIFAQREVRAHLIVTAA